MCKTFQSLAAPTFSTFDLKTYNCNDQLDTCLRSTETS